MLEQLKKEVYEANMDLVAKASEVSACDFYMGQCQRN